MYGPFPYMDSLRLLFTPVIEQKNHRVEEQASDAIP